MLKLKSITQNECPICGEDNIVSESVEADTFQNKIREHVMTNERWEKRTFLCGVELKYIPNLNQTKIKGMCKNDMRIEEIRINRGKAKKELINFINKNLKYIDDNFEKRLKKEIKSLKYVPLGVDYEDVEDEIC